MIFRILGDRWLRAVVLLLVIAAFANQVSILVWHLVPEPRIESSPLPAPASAVTKSSTSGTDYQQQASAIGRAFLFGKAAVEQKPVEVVEQAPQTNLNYKLRGVYFSPEESLSSAIVETRPNDSRHYLLGEELADKITLAGIEKDHIIINRYGKLERLDLEKPEMPSGEFRAQPSSGATAAQTALLRSYKKRYSSNPMALATRFQAIPVQQNGANVGFKLKALRGETLLKRLNFEPDDVFTAVNGVSLNNPFEALDALKSLTTADSVSVTILRNGSEQTLDFEI